jgi:cellulose synthase/poly-beta-1,6-N-acetylglucosamine synthase-like glycosyltransferase
MSDTALPFVSVVMPIRNEAAFISESLGAVLAQDYPADQIPPTEHRRSWSDIRDPGRP